MNNAYVNTMGKLIQIFNQTDLEEQSVIMEIFMKDSLNKEELKSHIKRLKVQAKLYFLVKQMMAENIRYI